MRQVKLVKAVKNPQTGQTEVYVPIVISPTVSKFGTGNDKFQWILGAIINGQYVKLCYLTDNQLLDFADKIKEAVLEKRFAVNIMGEQFVEQRINQLYAQKQVAHNQNTVNTTVNTANNAVTTANTAVPVLHTVTTANATTANAVGTGIQPVKPVTPIPNPANLPDIDTV